MTELTWEWFFVPKTVPLPTSAGFGLFSLAHLIALVSFGIAVAVLVIGYSHAEEKQRRQIRIFLGWSVLLLEALHQVAHIVSGAYIPDLLPLHACAVVTFLVFIDSQRSSPWTREPLYALGIWGAIAALAFPDWASRPILNIFTWQAFLIHACLLGYILMRLVAGEIVPDWRNLWRVLVILAVALPLSIGLNQLWGTNFWFLNAGAPGSPLEPIQSFTGAYYIPFLLVLLIVLWTLMYLPWALAKKQGIQKPETVLITNS